MCCPLKTPSEPFLYIAAGKERTCRCRRGVKVKALPYYLREINKLNEMIESEYMLILEKRREARAMTHSSSTVQTMNCSNGFVEFQSRAVKSSGKII
jgi:hypothetical protein